MERITLATAARIVRLSPDFLRQLVSKQRLKAEKVGGGHIWYTTREELSKYLAGRDVKKIPKKYRDRS